MSNFTCSPSETTVVDFKLATQHMQQLMSYVHWGQGRPTDFTGYVHELRLAPATANQLKEEIDWIVEVYANISTHCRSFKDDILPATVDLCREVGDYAENALYTQSVLWTMLDKLDKAIQQDDHEQKTKLQAIIDRMIDPNIETLDDFHNESGDLYRKIATFEQQTLDDDAVLKRKASAVALKQLNYQASPSKLRNAVDYLTRFIDASETKINQGVWVPLVGLVPKAVIETVEGKAAEKYIRTSFSAKKDAADEEVIYIQCDHMVTDLNTMSQLIEPAKIAIRLLQGFFRAMITDLKFVKRQVHNLRRPSETMSLDPGYREKRWADLARAAKHYTEIAFC
jgi:hypothetical protein